MKKIAAIVASILVPIVAVFVLPASDVQGGAALLPAGKVIGNTLVATVVTDVTGVSFAAGKGVTSIRVQKGGKSTSAIFTSSYVAGMAAECIAPGFPDVETTTANRFTGLADGFIDTPAPRIALFAPFGNPDKAVITDQHDVACTTVAGRQQLSFTALIKFEK